jgi:hypothetical protein
VDARVSDTGATTNRQIETNALARLRSLCFARLLSRAPREERERREGEGSERGERKEWEKRAKETHHSLPSLCF